ncbi:MAG: crosslink repair DNA glycosylase YcaQ family protein [Caldilineaceae bacterium]
MHRLIHEERHLFEYWAHCASLVLVEDYPVHEYMMRRHGKSGSAWSKRITAWVKENTAFRQYILDELRARGPLRTQDFADSTVVPWSSGGWTSGRSVSYMLDHLWLTGQILVAKRNGLERWWDLAERVLPVAALPRGWRDTQVTYDAAQKSLRALGIGRARDIQRHFIERRYPQLAKIMTRLQKEKTVLPVTVEGWPGEWFIHAETLPLLEQIEGGDWQPRTTLLSPFDNLIRDRDRTELMWDFFYRIEIYVPPAKRQYGYYVLPILHGDQLIGRIDPKMDWKQGVLTVNAIYPEASTPLDETTGKAVIQTIEQLACFLGATQIVYGDNVPAAWHPLVHS